jgi:D-alanyl-D-alanine carboxypeptidase
VSLTVRRDGVPVVTRVSGSTIDGAPATSDSPMVVASVSKLLTATMVARLDQAGVLDVDAPVPWGRLGLAPHPSWGDVTPRELLNHISGMPVARASWFTGTGDCRTHLSTLVAGPPRTHRGSWTYSNGNYCALGLLVEAVTGRPLDDAAQTLLFDPLGATGIHTTDEALPTDVAYQLGNERLSRLGGAGTFVVSTDDLTATLAAVTPLDHEVMTWPGLIVDQYGWGHTGTVDGAKSCAWTLEGDRTVVAATVSGGSPATGGDVCDRVVVAVATDLGIAAGEPDRTPP